MGYYLLDHPNPNYPQTRPRSAWGWDKPTGLVTVHTAEGALDRIAPDTGAENVAHYISIRNTAGGYHVLVDTDSTINMAPDQLMTWHTAAYNLNGPGWGISAACRSVEWDPNAGWTQTIIERMGAAIREFWTRQGHDPERSARWLSHEQVRNSGGRIVGLTHHGTVQPGDRSDAWATHPQKARLDQMLIDAIVGASGGAGPGGGGQPEEDEVTPEDREAIAQRTVELLVNMKGDGPANNLTQIRQDIADVKGQVEASAASVVTKLGPNGDGDNAYSIAAVLEQTK